MLLAAAFLTGCSQEDLTTDGNDKAEGITMTVNNFEVDGTTRTALTLDESYGLKFKWSEGDDVCMFDNKDNQQVLLKMTDGADVEKATFSSNGYLLSTENQYMAYYPYIDKVSQEPKIPVSYEGQTQTANNNYDHLAKFDYIVSDLVTPTSTTDAHFTFSHTGAILRLKIEMPEAGTWQSVTLSTTDEAFTTAATLDLFGRDFD